VRPIPLSLLRGYGESRIRTSGNNVGRAAARSRKLKSMRFDVYWIPESGRVSRLGIMSRARGNDRLNDEIASLCDQQINVLVSLLKSGKQSSLG
jgi:hypothetical protein